MDPNENLRQQRECLRVLTELEDGISIEDQREWRLYAEKLAGLTHDLDMWLCQGGHKPDDWTHRATKKGGTCRLCGKPKLAFQVYCGAACSARWEAGERP